LISATAVTQGCRVPAGPRAAAPTPQAGSAAPLYRFHSGDRLVYDIDYKSTGSTNFAALFQNQDAGASEQQITGEVQATHFKSSLQGELSVTVLGNRGEDFKIAFSLRDSVARLNVNGQEADQQAATIAADLGRGVLAIVDPTGKVVSLRFDAAAAEFSKTYGRAVLALLQFVLPKDPAAGIRQWEASEYDPAGQYIARYEAEASPSDAATTAIFKKTKIRYLELSDASEQGKHEVPTVITPGGQVQAVFDLTGGHLVSLNGTDSQITAIAGKTVGSSETTIKLNLKETQTLSNQDLRAIRREGAQREKSAAAVPLFVKPSEHETELRIARAELREDTTESLLSALDRAEAAAGTRVDETTLFVKFRALVYLHPESCRAIAKTLSRADAAGLSMRVLPAALKAVGSSAGQNAIAAAIRMRGDDWPALSKLIPNLAMAESPTVTAVRTLRDLAAGSQVPEVVSTAELGLGIMARSLTSESPGRSAKLVDLFIKWIDAASSESETRLFLLVLGNAGSRRSLPVVRRFVSDHSPVLRSAAISALRFVDSEEADDLLISALNSESDPEVRLKAAFSLSYREMNRATFDAQRKSFEADADERVRVSLLDNLWKARQSFPEVVDVVRQAAAKDASKEVRKAASQLLTGQ